MYGRIRDLYTVPDKKHTLAALKAFGKKSAAIVVEDVATAESCIQVFNARRVRETVWPHETLEPFEIRQHLRNAIQNRNDVFLLKDLVVARRNDVNLALAYACGDQLVAVNKDVAVEFTFGALRCRSVTLDGTLVDPRGSISGGAAELRQSSQQLNDEALRRAKAQLEENQAALKKHRSDHHEAEIQKRTLNREIEALRTRAEQFDKEIRETKQTIAGFDAKKTHIESELSNSQVRANANVFAADKQSPTFADDGARKRGDR